MEFLYTHHNFHRGGKNVNNYQIKGGEVNGPAQVGFLGSSKAHEHRLGLERSDRKGKNMVKTWSATVSVQKG